MSMPVGPLALPDKPLEKDLESTEGMMDFFGGSEKVEKWLFPGQDEQYIEYRIMNEGQRKKFQRKTAKDIKVDRKTQMSAIGLDLAGDREALITEVVCGWFIRDPANGSQPVPFDTKLTPDGKVTSGGTFKKWMDRADPRLIDKLELAIRDANPWMQDDMDPESIQEEIDRLVKLKEEAEKRAEFQS